MLWNKKRIDAQVYKVKGNNEFLIAYGEIYLTNTATQKVYAQNDVYTTFDPQDRAFSHSSASLDYLTKDCYPVSEKALKTKYPEWYKFFNDYLMEY